VFVFFWQGRPVSDLGMRSSLKRFSMQVLDYPACFEPFLRCTAWYGTRDYFHPSFYSIEVEEKLVFKTFEMGKSPLLNLGKGSYYKDILF